MMGETHGNERASMARYLAALTSEDRSHNSALDLALDAGILDTYRTEMDELCLKNKAT